MFNRIAGAAVASLMLVTTAYAAPIEGRWRTESGANAVISPCGGSYCIKITSGQHAGKQIGKVAGSGSSYRGSVTDPANGKTYSGSANVNGNSLRLKGCVARVLCKTQRWARR